MVTKKRMRRQPQRTCVACREVSGKRQLVRIVRCADGHVVVDPTGKLAGRGAYLCAQRMCWDLARERHALERALKCQISAEDAQEISRFAAGLPQSEPVES